MLKDLKGVSLLDILPQNLLEDAQIYAAAKSLDDELQHVTIACREVLHLPRLDELPEAALDLLAWQWHVDFYEPLGLDIATKRRLVKESIAWHRTKGTPAAVEKMIKATWGSANVEEWFEYGGEPYHFKVIIKAGKFPTLESFSAVWQAVIDAKNVRSALDSIKNITRLDFDDYEINKDGSKVPVTRKYKAIADHIHRHIVLAPENKYESPKLDVPLYAAGVITLHRNTVPGIYRRYGRYRAAMGGHIHRTIYMSLDLTGGGLNE